MIAGARVNPILARAFIIRGTLIWAGVRAIASAVLALAGGTPLHLSLTARVLMVAIAVIASLAQTVRLRERMLLGNLGVGPITVIGWFAAGAAAGEVLLAGLGAMLP